MCTYATETGFSPIYLRPINADHIGTVGFPGSKYKPRCRTNHRADCSSSIWIAASAASATKQQLSTSVHGESRNATSAELRTLRFCLWTEKQTQRSLPEWELSRWHRSYRRSHSLHRRLWCIFELHWCDADAELSTALTPRAGIMANFSLNGSTAMVNLRKTRRGMYVHSSSLL